MIDGVRLGGEIEALARISDAEYPAVKRVLYTPADLRARAWLKERFAEAGLSVREDAVGNTFARWPGAQPDLTAVATGSHTDAIPDSGRFDGVVGVLGALEAVRALRAEGFRPRRPIEVIMFTAEEPTRFGLGCIGSRMLAGVLARDRAELLRDAEGGTLDQARAAAGFTGPLEEVPLAPGAYAAFVELHIEQGPELEREGVPIGVVSAIAAPATLHVRFAGPGGHAGAVLMPLRHDPLLAAADVVLAVDRLARASGRPDTVGTAGVLGVQPAAVNSIPRLARLEIDVRDTDLATRDRVLGDIRAAAREAAARHGVEHDDEVVNADDPAVCDPAVMAAIAGACESRVIAHRMMVSRAYHDALFMARICPTGMIFVPSRGGVSHRPDEFTAPEDIVRGAEVLAGALRTLAG